MKRIILFLISLIFSSCSTSKKVINSNKKGNSKVDKIVLNAIAYKGTKYKYGGTTRKGMDCSGIVYVAFGKENIQLPRVSRDMAKEGKKVSLKNAKKGDLLFFKTSKRNNKINHVGLITSVNNGIIKFIHSTTSKGVIISSLTENYWKKAFVKVVNIL